MAGLPKYFVDTPYQVIDGNIVYASNLNSPMAAIAGGMEALSVDVQTSGSKYAVDTGAVNAYVVSIDPAPTEYTEGLEVWLKTSMSNTGASTINVNSLGVVDIRRHGLDPLLAGDIPANYFTLLKYSNGVFQIVSASGRGEAEASAEAAAESAVTATTQAGIATTQAEIATSAASLFPGLGAGEAEKVLTVNSSGDEYELKSMEEIRGTSLNSGVVLTGGIQGLNYSKTGDNEITVEAGNCYDETNTTWLSVDEHTVAIPTIINQIYHLFACSDGNVRVDTDINGANLSAYTKRWVGFVRTNSSGVVIEFTMSGDRLHFNKYNSLVVNTGINTTYVELGISSVIPISRVLEVTLGIWRSVSDVTGVYISKDGGVSDMLYLPSGYRTIGSELTVSPYDTVHMKAYWAGVLVCASITSIKLRR